MIFLIFSCILHSLWVYSGVSLRAGHRANSPDMRTILSPRFNHLEERFPYKEVQFKKFCRPVKTSCPPAENVNETPVYYELTM